MSDVMLKLARAMAVLGGLVLTVLVLMVCVSILGRGGNTFAHWDTLVDSAPGVSETLIGLGLGPIPGDFELVEAGIAFAIFAFLPLCQISRGHASVDVFTSMMPMRINLWLSALWECLLTALVLLITWRLGVGMLDKAGNGETTFILQFPIWWAYAASFFAALVAAIIAVYCAIVRVGEAVSGRLSAHSDTGAVH